MKNIACDTWYRTIKLRDEEIARDTRGGWRAGRKPDGIALKEKGVMVDKLIGLEKCRSACGTMPEASEDDQTA